MIFELFFSSILNFYLLQVDQQIIFDFLVSRKKIPQCKEKKIDVKIIISLIMIVATCLLENNISGLYF